MLAGVRPSAALPGALSLLLGWGHAARRGRVALGNAAIPEALSFDCVKRKRPRTPERKTAFCSTLGITSPSRGWGGNRCCGARFAAHCFARAGLVRCRAERRTLATQKSSGDSLLLPTFKRCICLCWARRLRRAAYVGMGADLPHVALLVLRCSVVGDGVLDVPYVFLRNRSPAERVRFRKEEQWND